MRLILSLTLPIALLVCGSAGATDSAAPASTGPKPGLTEFKTRSERLDALFLELKRARNVAAADRIAGRIWGEWNRSGNAAIDFLMVKAQDSIEKKKFDAALDMLDQVVLLDPDYAEGWNRRATVHFLMHSFAKSMADIDRTLQLEPRHFGALQGLAQIMKGLGNRELALDAYQRVLDIYPMRRDAQTEVGTLSEDLAGDAI